MNGLRYTPAGIAALDLLLEHTGNAQVLGITRQVKMQIKAVAFGALAERLLGLPLGTLALCEGFLAMLPNRKALCLHLQRFEINTCTAQPDKKSD